VAIGTAAAVAAAAAVGYATGRLHRRRRPLRGGALACGGAATACLRPGRGSWAQKRAHAVLRRAGPIRVSVAEESDLAAAARIAVRALKWTGGTFEGNEKITDADYEFLAANEIEAYREGYLRSQRFSSTFLVAKEDAPENEKGGAGFFDALFSGLFGTPSKVVGCVGCSVESFNRADGKVVSPEFASIVDTVQRPVMADLAVDDAYRGRGIARQLISKLEEVVRGWGYKELALLVEASNLQAIGVYNRLGYTLEAMKPDTETSYLNTDGKPYGRRRIEVRRTVALLMRREL